MGAFLARRAPRLMDDMVLSPFAPAFRKHHREGHTAGANGRDFRYISGVVCAASSHLTTRWSGPWVIVGRVWPRHRQHGRPLNSAARSHTRGTISRPPLRLGYRPGESL